MIFGHYKERGAVLAADVVNTRGSVSGRELIEDDDALEDFLVEHDIPLDGGRRQHDVQAFRDLRDRLHDIFFAEDDDRTADLLNAGLRATGAVPQVAGSGDDRTMEFRPLEGGPVAALSAATMLGLAALFAESGRSRFGICSADDCRDVYIDTSKNRSRRYCAESCSSRMNVAAYRARMRTN